MIRQGAEVFPVHQFQREILGIVFIDVMEQRLRRRMIDETYLGREVQPDSRRSRGQFLKFTNHMQQVEAYQRPYEVEIVCSGFCKLPIANRIAEQVYKSRQITSLSQPVSAEPIC